MSIIARNISKRFGDFTALDDVSLEVEGGSLTALLGPSGSGKSTLLRLLLGLLRARTGSVEMFGGPPTDLGDRSRLGYVPQRGHLAPECGRIEVRDGARAAAPAADALPEALAPDAEGRHDTDAGHDHARLT